MNELSQRIDGLYMTNSATITFGTPVAGDTITVAGETYSYVAAAPGAGEFSNITELKNLIEAATSGVVQGTVNGGTLLLETQSSDPAILAIELGESNTGTMAISGNMEGADGVDSNSGGLINAFYSNVVEFSDANPTEADAVYSMEILSSAGDETCTIIPQVSADKETWIDRPASPSAIELSAGNLTKEQTISEPLAFLRLKISLSAMARVNLKVNVKRSN